MAKKRKVVKHEVFYAPHDVEGFINDNIREEDLITVCYNKSDPDSNNVFVVWYWVWEEREDG